MRSPLVKIRALSQKINPLGALSQNHRHVSSDPPRNNHSSQANSGQITSERHRRVELSKTDDIIVSGENSEHMNGNEHRIDIGDESSDLLGQLVSGKLVRDKKNARAGLDGQIVKSKTTEVEVDAKLTIKAFVWGSHTLSLDDVIAVSYSDGLRRFTIHAYSLGRGRWLPCPFGKTQRRRKDLHFLASTSDDALRWVTAFAGQQCFVNCLPHPLLSSKVQGSILDARDFPPVQPVKCRSPAMLVILNPRSGRGRSSKVFYSKVEPIFKLAGFKFEVVATESAGHARTIASKVDLSTCPDGIICVGGDGIVNEEVDDDEQVIVPLVCDGKWKGKEIYVRKVKVKMREIKVLNGLISRDDPKEAMKIPLGIIPAGSDNSLVWTVLGVRDPVSAAVAIVKGGLTATDIFAVEWIQTGTVHVGITVAYYGFVSDVLELSEKYQKRFGPLRYFVAGALKFFCLPKYNYEIEYLPVPGPTTNISSKDTSQVYTGGISENHSENYGMKPNIEGLTRAASLSSIDSILMTPNQMSGDLDMMKASTYASSEPSDYVRGLDTKTKRLSSGRNNLFIEPEEVVHPPLPGSATPTRPRTRSKSRTDKGWTGLSTANDCSRYSWGNTVIIDREDISSTMSDPGPIWDAEPKWDTGPKWDAGPKWDTEHNLEAKGLEEEFYIGGSHEGQRIEEEKWVVRHGPFLGVLICNHQCKTVQNLRSQVLAPTAEHDDSTLDLLLVRAVGRLQLLRFFLLMQFGRHLSLPFVEYTKVKSVKLTPGKNVHQGCGIDGELLSLNGPISTSLHSDQCKLIGRPVRHAV